MISFSRASERLGISTSEVRRLLVLGRLEGELGKGIDLISVERLARRAPGAAAEPVALDVPPCHVCDRTGAIDGQMCLYCLGTGFAHATSNEEDQNVTVKATKPPTDNGTASRVAREADARVSTPPLVAPSRTPGSVQAVPPSTSTAGSAPAVGMFPPVVTATEITSCPTPAQTAATLASVHADRTQTDASTSAPTSIQTTPTKRMRRKRTTSDAPTPTASAPAASSEPPAAPASVTDSGGVMADLEGAVATLSAHVETDADAAIDRDVEDFQAEFGSLAISSADHAEWVIAKLLDRQSQRDRLKAQYEAMDRELEHDMRGLAFRFGAPLEGYVRSRLTGNKRSVKTLHGTAGLRTVGGGFRLADKQAAAEWALGQTAPELFGAFAFNVDSKALAKHAKVTGEIPDGLEAKATRDTFYVASGGVRVDVGALATPSTSSALERNDDNQDEEEIRS